jgi:membrane-associated protease RseP (regulator of RpoE activity)
MQVSQKVGLVAIMGLMAVALFNDLSRLFGS